MVLRVGLWYRLEAACSCLKTAGCWSQGKICVWGLGRWTGMGQAVPPQTLQLEQLLDRQTKALNILIYLTGVLSLADLTAYWLRGR